MKTARILQMVRGWFQNDNELNRKSNKGVAKEAL